MRFACTKHLVVLAALSVALVCGVVYAAGDAGTRYESAYGSLDHSSQAESEWSPGIGSFAATGGHRRQVAAQLIKARTVRDCPHGETLVVWPGESIQDAVDAAGPGDRIVARPGVYHESVVIETDCLSLMGGWDGPGDPDGWAALDGTGAGENAFEVRADHTTIKGFEIRNYTGVGDQNSGVGTGVAVDAWGDGSDYGTVKGNYIHDMSWGGVSIANNGSSVKTGWSVKDNVIDTEGHAAVRLTNCSGCEVKSNLLSSFRFCVLITVMSEFPDPIAVSGVDIKDNEMVGCAQTYPGPGGSGAVWVEMWQEPDVADLYLSDVTVASNYIHDTRAGIFFRDRSPESRVSGFRVTDNVVANQNVFGILINRTNDVHISGNWLENIGVRGIGLIFGASGNLVAGNTVIGTGSDGIFVFLPSSYRGPAAHNVFRDNTVIDAGRHGIGLAGGAHDNTVEDNEVSGSGSGCDHYWDESGSGNCWEENTGAECPDPLPGC